MRTRRRPEIRRAYVVLRTTRQVRGTSVVAMTTTSPDRPVLVVGAGPTGLTLAAQLLSRGSPTRIADRRGGPPPSSRAPGVPARPPDLLDPMGLAAPFLPQGPRLRRFQISP